MQSKAHTTDDAAIAVAEAALAELAAEYPGYAQADVDQMKRFADKIAEGIAQGLDVARDLDALHGVAHNVKGQGASFGYELMTVLGEALCEKLRDRLSIEEADLTVVRALVAACDTVLMQRLTGMGGTRGAALLAGAGLAAAAF